MNTKTYTRHLFLAFLLSCFVINPNLFSQGFEGYYRYPDIHQDRIVFNAEDDLWIVPVSGGAAKRLTTHPEAEMFPVISPDGKTIAFSASYEGPMEIYTMPIDGGLTTRWTYEEEQSFANSWTSAGEILYDTPAYSGVPDVQVVKINTVTRQKELIPLSQASEASMDNSGKTIYFVRPGDHGNVTKRYKGGTARQIWKFTEGSEEAVRLTRDYAGESHHPVWYDGRVYFISDRDGIMNLWSMDEEGNNLVQHTMHTDFDVTYAKASDGRIVYQRAGDLWLHDIEANTQTMVNVTLTSDLDQLREKWDDDPAKYITSVHPDKEGKRIIITARGRIFVAPVSSGRFISFTDKKDVRYRDAVFSHDDKNIIALSDESGEFEFIRMPANGVGPHQDITRDGNVLRFVGVPSPDGQFIAYSDLDGNMFVLTVASGVSKKISTNQEGIRQYSWSPDSKWLAFVQLAENTMARILIHGIESGKLIELTTDRANSLFPSWSPDGKFIYFLSDRSFTSLVDSPWGTRQPDPYFDASEKLYHVALQKGTRSPFRPEDELFEEEVKDEDEKDPDKKKEKKAVKVMIDGDGIKERITEVPLKPGNYRDLTVTEKIIYLMSSETGVDARSHLSMLKIDNEEVKLETLVEDIDAFELSGNQKKILYRKKNDYFMIDAGQIGDEMDPDESMIDLSDWKFPITPREDWKQIYTDAWRMERDYFYDRNMHGVDWDAMYVKYLPLVDRVTTRSELSEVIGHLIGELSALHTSVRDGDHRNDKQDIAVATLGAEFSRDEINQGFRIDYIYQADPDYPDERSPLDDPYHDIAVGDVITQVNGTPALQATDIGDLIRNQVGKQVRLRIKRGNHEKDVVVTPTKSEFQLRYRDWEYGNRLKVDQMGQNQIGYLHLRAMGSEDLSRFYREFYPVFNRPGLIVDVRYNFGGNIDSFILEKLMRKAWMYWKGRTGNPYWNMHYAFRGHIVVLVSEETYSDGEAFADGFRRLGLGTTIGTRTWGGEIWLHSGNRLSDDGIARAPMFGVYGPEGEWLIEGHGFEPDIVVDNLPHATFKGKDAQLEAAVEYLQKLIEEDPREVPEVPPYPDKSFGNKD